MLIVLYYLFYQISVEKRVNQGYPQVQQSSAGNHLFEVPEVMPSQSRLKQVSKALPKLSLDVSYHFSLDRRSFFL